jgi:hypothetical protein
VVPVAVELVAGDVQLFEFGICLSDTLMPALVAMREAAGSPAASLDLLTVLLQCPNVARKLAPGVPRPVTLSQPGPVCCDGEPE